MLTFLVLLIIANIIATMVTTILGLWITTTKWYAKLAKKISKNYVEICMNEES